MASHRMSSRAVNLTGGWVCLASASLNWWNMVGVGFAFWRILLASTLTLIGVWLLVRSFRTSRASRP